MTPYELRQLSLLPTSVWYLATPYNKFPPNRTAAYNAAVVQVSILVRRGVKVYSPIVHNHPIGKYVGRRPSSFWLAFDRNFMCVCCGLIVCKLATWEESEGVDYEIKKFGDMYKPVIYMEPGTVPQGL